MVSWTTIESHIVWYTGPLCTRGPLSLSWRASDSSQSCGCLPDGAIGEAIGISLSIYYQLIGISGMYTLPRAIVGQINLLNPLSLSAASISDSTIHICNIIGGECAKNSATVTLVGTQPFTAWCASQIVAGSFRWKRQINTPGSRKRWAWNYW